MSEPITPESLAHALSIARGRHLSAETKVVLFYLGAYPRLNLGELAVITELTRNEVRIALMMLGKQGWLVKPPFKASDPVELKLPPRFANTPHEPDKPLI
jgi:hypothetical protein